MNSPEHKSTPPAANILMNFEEMCKAIVDKDKMSPKDAQNRVSDSIKKDAKKYVDGVASKNAETKKTTEQNTRNQIYDKEHLQKAQTEVKTLPPETVPEYVHITKDSIQNPAVAEYVLRLSKLPPDLQQNPQVILQEATRLYNSVEWTSSSMTREAYKEAVDVINSSFVEVRKLTANKTDWKFVNDTSFADVVDSRINIYRMKRPEELPDSERVTGMPPLKHGTHKADVDHPDYSEWERKYGRMAQQEKLEETLRYYQNQLDITDGNDYQQKELLNELTRNLNSGNLDKKLIVDLKRELGVTFTLPHSFNEEETQPYLNEARDNKQILDERIRETNDKKREDENRVRENARNPGVTWGEAYAKIEDKMKEFFKEQFKSEPNEAIRDQKVQAALLKFKNLHSPDEVHRFGRLSAEDGFKMLDGMEAQQKWLSDKLYDVYGAGREQAKKTLTDEFIFEDFKQYMKWLYGGELGSAYMAPFEFLWSDRGKLDYVVKILMYEPSDIKDKLGALRKILGADLDGASKVTYAPLAIESYLQTLSNFQSNQKTRYKEAVNFLKSDTVNPSLLGQDGTLIINDTGVLSDPKSEEYKKFVESSNFSIKEGKVQMQDGKFLAKDGSTLTYDDYFDELHKLYKSGQLSESQLGEYYQIYETVEIAAAGTMLKDSDVLVKSEVYHEMLTMQRKLGELNEKSLDSKNIMSPEEQHLLDRLPEIIKKRQGQLAFLEATGDKIQLLPGERETSPEVIRAYSPLEREVRRNLIMLVEEEKGLQPGEHLKAEDEWMIRDAIFAARMTMITSGHLMTEGAVNVVKPMAERGALKSIKIMEGKSVMWAPFMEDIDRIINPMKFSDRFGMSGEWGNRVRDLMQTKLLESKKYTKGMITKSKEFEALEEEFKGNAEAKFAFGYMKFAEAELGGVFGELLDASFMQGGGSVDASTWRPEIALLDGIRKEYVKNGRIAAFENIGMGLKIAMLNPENEVDVLKRMELFEKMLDRTPSVYIQLLGGNKISELKEKYLITDTEWSIFQRALTLSESKLCREDTKGIAGAMTEDLISKNVIMRGLVDGAPPDAVDGFTELLQPYLLKVSENTMTEERTKTFQNVLRDIREHVLTERDLKKEKRQYKTVLEAFARHQFPMTLTLADIDWKDANFQQLGTAAMDRRGRDMMGMSQARDLMFQILYTPEFISPNGEKGIQECIKKFLELRTSINSYAHFSAADKATKEVIRVWLEFNRGRAVNNIKNPLGWLPVSGAMRALSEVDLDHVPILKNAKWYKNLLKTNLPGSHHKVKDLPHSIAEAVSLSARYFGAEGNAWDVHKMNHILDEIDRAGVFIEGHKNVSELKREFNTGLFPRLFDIPRKYWWVVIAATVAVAATSSASDQKKSGGHH